MEFLIQGREASARCAYTQKKGECFRVQIPSGTPSVVISAEALMHEIRRIGMQATDAETPLDGTLPPPAERARPAKGRAAPPNAATA